MASSLQRALKPAVHISNKVFDSNIALLASLVTAGIIDILILTVNGIRVFSGMDDSAAGVYLTTMRLHKRYLEDVWV